MNNHVRKRDIDLIVTAYINVKGITSNKVSIYVEKVGKMLRSTPLFDNTTELFLIPIRDGQTRLEYTQL